MSRKVVILGSTGSIGKNAVWVADQLKEDIQVVGVAARQNVQQLVEQTRKLGCKYAAVADETRKEQLAQALPAYCKALYGIDGMVEMATAEEVDTVLCAVVGTSGLKPVLAAVNNGKNIALASKEILVMAGEIVTKTAIDNGVNILPVDSEHAAIFQCLEGHNIDEVRRLILTASGGPFRQTPIEDLNTASYKDALAHPTWDMGAKITIDSASMMNKALELIEAKWLFNMSPDNIDVLVHPQSIVHSIVELIDGGMLAHLGIPDMRQPIQYALTYPQRKDTELPRCDLAKIGSLTFENMDNIKFPAVELARRALKIGGTAPAVLNAANEVAVELFRKGDIAFPEIAEYVKHALEKHDPIKNPELNDILKADARARRVINPKY